MLNKNSNLISLMQCFDDICEDAIKIVDSSFNTSANCFIPNNTTGGNNFYPSRNWYDFEYWWTKPITTTTYLVDTPSYPVSNFSVMRDGTSVIEVAISGFESDEVTVKREDLKIIVEGKKKNQNKEDDRKYIYKQIAERNFSIDFLGSDKWDYDKLKAKIKNGVLKIEVPMKEECKPVNRVYEISK